MVLFYLQPGPREQQSLSCIGLGWPPFLGPSCAMGRLYCQHLPPILAQGPPRNGAKPALTRADPPIFGLSWAYRPARAYSTKHATNILAGLTPLLGPSGRHKGAWFSSIFNPGPGSNRASVALAWVDPLLGPSWRHAGAWSPSIFNPGPGSNRASVALTWVGPPSGPILAHMGASSPSIFNPGPGSNRASVALTWVGPPFWAHLVAM